MKVKIIFLTLLFFLLSGCDQSTSPYDTYTHSGLGIFAAALTKDGNQALVSTVDLGVQLWDLDNKKLRFQLTHADKNTDIVVMDIAKEAPIAITLDANSMVVWDTRTGKSFRHLKLNAYPTSVTLSKTGKYALIGFANYKAQLIDLTQGEIIKTFQHADIVNAVALSDNGQYAVIGSDDTAVRVWDLNTGEMKYQWFHPKNVTHVNISPDNRYLLSVSSQKKTWIHDLKTGQLVTELDLAPKYNVFRTPPPSVSASKFTKDGKTLITGHPPKMIRTWDIQTGKLLKEYIIPQRSIWKPTSSVVLALSLSLDERFIIAETSNGMGYKFDRLRK